MGPKTYTEQRLRAFLAEVNRLEQSEFPYKHSEDALVKLQAEIEASLQLVERLPANASLDVVKQRCAVELTKALSYLPLMGFLLRSTNVRNSFEVFRPILRVSQALLGAVGVAPSDVKVLLSSEWVYSPFVYLSIPYLRGYVLVGLPASESANPLILPLAGHELGHTVWSEGSLEQSFQAAVSDQLIGLTANDWPALGVAYQAYAGTPAKDRAAILADMFVMEVIAEAYRLAISQLEETFCDFLGVKIQTPWVLRPVPIWLT